MVYQTCEVSRRRMSERGRKEEREERERCWKKN